MHPEIYYNDIYSEPEINTEKNCGSIECNDSLLAVNNLPTANENVLQVGNNIINEDIRLDNDITLNNMDVYDIDFENNNFENLKIDIDYGLTEDVSKVTETFIGNFANDDFKAILETTNEVSCNDSGDDPTKTNSEVYKTSKDLILDSSETTEKSNPCITKETVEKIKMLCTKVDVNRKKPNRKTCIWNFFDVTLDTRIYKCSFCFIEISIAPKCVSNLKRHLILQHSLEYDLIMKYAPFNDPCKVMTPLLYAFAETDPNIIRNFEIFDEGCYKCKLCGQVIVCATNRPLLIGHLLNYVMLPTSRGKQLLMFHGYTYSMNNRGSGLFYCSKKAINCKASVKLDANGKIVRAYEQHNHSPPKYVVTAKGEFLKVN
ncbi:uncharacterized protein LOC114239887 [Bombyx mandarina]|uniref:Uncharacterized protein LOC114239887 n=1 Tax=Bombyx mandarina TaxID=7092 RepID=A0A6J2J9Q9_BOMMA|nr:uncharacterized protein LOC114239887 [Bombyx mandarina]